MYIVERGGRRTVRMRPVVGASASARVKPPMRMPEVSLYKERSTTSTLRLGAARAASQAIWTPRNVLPEPPLLFANVRLSIAGMVRRGGGGECERVKCSEPTDGAIHCLTVDCTKSSFYYFHRILYGRMSEITSLNSSLSSAG
jgi:hypothetical protein